MVGACVLNIIINIFQPNNYHGQLSGYSAFRQIALKWFSNTWCKLHILLYSYRCVQVAITQIRLYICTGKTFFYCLSIQWVVTFHKPVQLFFVLVYIMCCTVIMHIQNWNNSPVTMLKSGPLLGHHCILMSGCSCCCCFCCCCHCVCMQACGRVCEEKSGAWYDT